MVPPATIDEEKASVPSPRYGFATPTPGVPDDQSLSTFNSEDKIYKRRLSSISKKFDRGDKGYLDETEQALRRLDSQNQGELPLDKVYQIMSTLQSAQKRNDELLTTLQAESKRNGSLRRTILVLSLFAILLTVANIGTSFAAARLAKDTRVAYDGDFVSSSTGVRLGTTAKEVTLTMQPVSEERLRRHRHLVEVTHNSSGLLCQQGLKANTTCSIQGQMRREEAQALHDSLCPVKDADGYCVRTGVNHVQLSCKGRMVSEF